MPTSIIPIPKARDAAGRVNQPVRIDPGETATRITNPSNITIYYKSTDTVSDTSNDGTLTQGQTLNLTTTEYLLGAERTEILLEVSGASTDRDLGLGAVFAPMLPFPGQLGALTVAGSTVYAVRFVPSRNMAITKIAFAVTTAAGANDNCDVGILDAGGNRIGSSGATAGKLNALGSPSVSLTATTNILAGNVYFAAVAVGVLGGTAAVIQGMSDGTFRLNSLLNGGVADNRTFSLSFGSNATIPTSLTLSSGSSSATGPILALME